ncbi:unnamed protein product, partial [Strongylus vulgaris]
FTENVLDPAHAVRCSYQVFPQEETCVSNGIDIGARLLHQWSCSQVNGNFIVHTCFVIDPVTHRSEIIVDSNGCTVDKSIITNISYAKNGTVTALGKAIRFPDTPVVSYSCRLRLLSKEIDPSVSIITDSQTFLCRSKRGVVQLGKDAVLATVEPYTREYDTAVYDDDVGAMFSGLGPATKKMMKEKTSIEERSRSILSSSVPSLATVRRISSIAPFFPYGGVDVTLNSKSVAVVRTKQARDRFKHALQLRSNSAQTASVAIPDNSFMELTVLREETKQKKPLLVPTSNTRNLHSLNAASKNAKSFVRRSSEDLSQLSTLSQRELLAKEIIADETTADMATMLKKSGSISTSVAAHISFTSATTSTRNYEEEVQDNESDEVVETVVTSELLVVLFPHEKFVTVP